SVLNRAFLALTNGTREEFEGRDVLDALVDEDRGRVESIFARVLRRESVSGFEARFRRKAGGTALVVLRAAPVASPAGDVDGVLFVGHDLTEIRGLQEQVIQAEKLATLGELAAGVVHELNNPLTSITVYSDYLLKKYESAGADPGDAEK